MKRVLTVRLDRWTEILKIRWWMKLYESLMVQSLPFFGGDWEKNKDNNLTKNTYIHIENRKRQIVEERGKLIQPNQVFFFSSR